jgi:hypothetical protein
MGNATRSGLGSPRVEERNWMPIYAITIQVVTTLLLSIRLLSRLRPGGLPGLDDIFITIAWLLASALTAVVLLGSFIPFTTSCQCLPGAQESTDMDGIDIYGMSHHRIGLQDGWYSDP